MTAADPFARATAKHANGRATEALTSAQQALEIALHVRRQQQTQRPPMFAGRCSLCGDPCKPRQRYCHAHGWAA